MTAPDPDNSNSDVHYRLYNSPKEGPVVICVQWFDYLDYDASRIMTPEAYDTEDEAEAALRALRCAATTSTGQLLDIEPGPPGRAWHAATPPVVRERLPYEELRKRYGTGDIVYWGRRVLGFEKDAPMTCPNCDPLATENAALRERVARLEEEVLAYHAHFMRREYGYDCTNRAELTRRAYAEADHIIDGDRDAAPGGEGGK